MKEIAASSLWETVFYGGRWLEGGMGSVFEGLQGRCKSLWAASSGGRQILQGFDGKLE